MSVSESEWRQWAERSYPLGKKADKRKIIRCSDPNYWYVDKVGETINVHYFATFGAWTTDGKWVYYYDLSQPI